MVTFTEIAHAIKDNSVKDFSVQSCIPKHQSSIELISLDSPCSVQKENPFGKLGLRLQVSKPLLQPPIMNSESDSESEIPIPIPKALIVKEPEPTPQPKQIAAKLSETLPQPKQIATKNPEPQQVQQKKFLEKESTHFKQRPQDPICIGISQRDPMYEIASPAVKQSIETEEARIIESKISDLYKSESGRSRGWTKTQLEAFIQPRVSSGGSLLPKQQFPWDVVFTDKQASAILDFICLAKGIRLAVWNDTERCVGIWPAADLSESKQTPLLYHVDKRGSPIQKSSVFETGWSLRAAMSVEHGLEKLSIDELDTFAEKMGIELSGKKAERVRTLAAARTRQRLSNTPA